MIKWWQLETGHEGLCRVVVQEACTVEEKLMWQNQITTIKTTLGLAAL